MLLEDYTLTRSLGKGAFGEVFLATKKNSNLLYAVKVMDRRYVEDPKYIKYFVNEVSILRTIYHKNIIKLEDLKKTKNHYYIVMDYCNGGSLKSNLDEYMKKYSQPFPEKIVQHIMRQVVSAIKYLHGLKIVHRDLKLDNILVNYNSEEDKKSINLFNAEIKLIDFGCASHISNVSILTTALGTPIYMDPRILKKKISDTYAKFPQTYDEKADIWSLGILCYQMLMGEYAFSGNSLQEISSKIEEGTFKVPLNLSKETISFLIDMLQYESQKRINAIELSNHPFLIKCIDDFSYINIKNVSNKISYGDLYINIKNNNTICSVVNKEGVKQLNIDSIDLLPKEKKETIVNPFNSNKIIIQTGTPGHSMNALIQRGGDNSKNININKQEILNSAPIHNSSNINKDPVINQLLNMNMPKQEKKLLNSIILMNGNKTQMINSPNKNIIEEQKRFQNNSVGIPGNMIYPPNGKKIQNYPSNKNQINPLNQQMINNQQMKNIQQIQTIPKKEVPNQLYNNNNALNLQNNNQMKYNQMNRSAGNVGPKPLSSQNLTYLQIRNSDGKYNTIIPKGVVSEFNLGTNNNFNAPKVNYSDNKLPIMDINNINVRNNFTAYKMQQFPPKI